MFREKAQAIIDLAKDYAFSSGSSELTLSAVLAAMINQQESAVLLAECLGMTPEKLRTACPEFPKPVACPSKFPLAKTTMAILVSAKKIAEEVPDRSHPGLIDLRHLVCAIAASREACAILNVTPMKRVDAVSMLASWYEKDIQLPRLDELTERLLKMRTELLTKVFGQDHAVYAFVEGVFNAEVVAAADTKRKAPRALFVFAGPPGVGKTYLAELGASVLERPFKRFDMSAYSGHQQNEALVGVAKNYQGAHPGTLTEFVEKNPNAVLLFDEIEKSHIKTIQLFLQVLDAGILEDKYYERNVSFRDTTIIFTTNAGRKLYDRPNASGVHSANTAFHRKTILDALENEKDPQTGQPFFPAPICSRMATGYPVLFNYLRVNELERVVQAEISRVASLLERQYYKKVLFHDLLPICMVLREGVRVDARTLCSQAETFIKTEIFKFCQLFKTERIEEVFDKVDRIYFGLDEDPRKMDVEVRALFEQQEHPRILLVADSDLTNLYREYIPNVDWRTAATAEDALQVLADEEVDMVLLDLWIGGSADTGTITIQHFDHVPLAARRLGQGQELLRKIRDRLPEMPVFLLSLTKSDGKGDTYGSIDEELFMACVRGGGARGMVASHFIDGMVKGWEERRDRFTTTLLETCGKLYREKAAARMGNEHKVLTFDTVPRVSEKNRDISIRLRNLRLTRAITAADAGEILEDVERPRTRFDDVIGANAAKEELKFFIDYLKNPRRFAALGLKPPKGVLLHGPPGTGKTMLARAMAGESNVAFIPVSASSFVTIWQGSGPQSVRDLFARAHRYAPAIIFIDEIDAIGRVRTGGVGGQATENTLNALFTEMDGFTSPSPDRPVFILSATNFRVDADDQASPERSTRTLDPALVRRFSRTILVDLPERAARQQYLSMRLENRAACTVSDETIKLIAERSSGMSIANLESIIETAARSAAKANEGLNGRLLEEAFEAVRFGEARARDPEAVKKTAVHEAGHTIMYWLSGWWPSYVTVVSRDSHGGYMAPCSTETEKGNFTKDELLFRICVSFGGRAAETLVYPDDSGLSTGASGDLEHATNIARQMVCRYGMDDEFGLLATPELMKYEGAMSSPVYLRLNEAASKILKEQMARTQKFLEENRQHLDTVVKALIQKERLTAENLQNILPPIPGTGAQSGKKKEAV
jgi:ATP-dependent metalloprotease FtsH